MAEARRSRWTHRSAAIMLLTHLMLLVAATVWAAAPQPSVTWTTKADFEKATRTNIDTTTKVDSVIIADGSKDFVTTATITCITAGKIYTTGVDRASVGVIDAQTRQLLRTIPLPGRAAGAVFNTIGKKLYIGQYDDNKVSVIDTVSDTVRTLTLTQGTAGKGAYAAAFNPDNNKVYLVNTSDSTVTVLDGVSDSELVTKKVTAGATTASYDAGKLYLTSKSNEYVTVVDGVTDDVVQNVEVVRVQSILGGQAPGSIGLRVPDAASLGITRADTLKLSWTYECSAKDQKVQFQARAADDAASLDAATYEGPNGASTWYESVCDDPTTEAQTGSATLSVPFKNATEIQLQLVSDGLSTPTLHDVTLTFEAFADLVALDPTLNSDVVAANAPVSVSAQIKNIGRSAAPVSLVGFTLVSDSGYSSFLTGEPVPALEPEQVVTVNANMTIPDVSNGKYYIKVCADSGNSVDESNEDNNCALVPLDVTQPDLVVSTLSGPTSAVIGSSISVASTVKNTGAVAAKASSAKLYLTRNEQDIPLTERTVGALAAGGSDSATTSVAVPNVTTGDYHLKACADSTEQVNEIDEQNNCFIAPEIISIYSTTADFAVTAVSGSVSGGKLTYSVTVKNWGQTAADARYLGIYLSADNAVTPADTLVTSQYVGTLDKGASRTYTSWAYVPDNFTGTVYVGGFADYQKLAPEADETNNGLAGNQVTITNDLVIVPGSVTGSVSGGKLNYSFAVQNTGNGVASLNFAGVYLSADANITTGDTLVTSVSGGSILGGSSSTFSSWSYVPTDMIGTYYVGAYADYLGRTPEADDGNNSLAGNQVTITNDLVIVPGSVTGSVSGGKLNYSFGVQNTGNGVASLSFSGVYLSADSNITTGDTAVTSVSGGSILGGSSSTFSNWSYVPTDLIGTYYIGAYADYLGRTPEADNGNNSLAGNQVTITNDLVIVPGSVTGSVSGGKLNYSFAVQNTGNGVASVNFSGVYLSADSNITTGDTAVTSVSGGSILGGSSSTFSNWSYVPTDLIGTYYIGAYTDYLGRTPEADNGNNSLAGNQVTITNDLVIVPGSVSGSVSGGKLNYSFAVQNTGNGVASLSFSGVYLSADSNITTGDTLVTSVSGGSITGGSSSTFSGWSYVPTDTIGTYYVGAIADYLARTPEADDGNNSLAGNQVTITNDLVIVTGSVTGSVSGGKLAYSFGVRNTGNGVASLNFAGVYLSADSNITTGDTLVTNVSGGSIMGGSSSTFSGWSYVPTDTIGTYYVGAIADYLARTPEADDGNNSLAGNQVTITNDLVIVPGSVSGSVSGGKLNYSFTVQNTGNGVASLNFAGVYLSAETNITTGDTLVTNVSGGSIMGGSSSTFSGWSYVPTDTIGTYYVGAIADYLARTPEADDGNNSLAGNQVTITNDLVIVPGSVTGSVSGGKLTYSFAVQNTGNGVASLSFAGVYLSADTNITTADTLVTSVSGGSIVGGSSSTFSSWNYLPTGVTGTYYLGAYADYLGRTPEAEETNNSLAGNQVTL